MLPQEATCIIRAGWGLYTECQKCSPCVICGTNRRGASREIVKWSVRKFRCARERFRRQLQTRTWPSRCTRVLCGQAYCPNSCDRTWRSWRSIRWWARPCFWTWISMIVPGHQRALMPACNNVSTTTTFHTKMLLRNSNHSSPTISMCLKIRAIWV